MEALATLGLASNVVQFVDFASRLISKSHELYTSSDGMLIEQKDLALITRDMKAIVGHLKQSQGPAADQLQTLSTECFRVADELIGALKELQCKGPPSRYKSVRQALRFAWSKEKIHEIEKRLHSLREQINLRICANLR